MQIAFCLSLNLTKSSHHEATSKKGTGMKVINQIFIKKGGANFGMKGVPH